METTEKVMTIKEILIDVHKVLGEIEVPASKIEQIGVPIARSMNGIQACVDAITREELMAQNAVKTEKEENEDA